MQSAAELMHTETKW